MDKYEAIEQFLDYSLEQMQKAESDAAGYGDQNEVMKDCYRSIIMAVHTVKGAETLWWNDHWKELNGVMPGGIQFGIIGHRQSLSIPEDFDQPENLPQRWSFHS